HGRIYAFPCREERISSPFRLSHMGHVVNRTLALFFVIFIADRCAASRRFESGRRDFSLRLFREAVRYEPTG
ncbi:MAG: hypothetical protein IKR16_06100, partial [Firmicutes bacterium]|nr:hypothetical protein [Bacillota bacterium]